MPIGVVDDHQQDGASREEGQRPGCPWQGRGHRESPAEVPGQRGGGEHCGERQYDRHLAHRFDTACAGQPPLPGGDYGEGDEEEPDDA